MSAATLPSLLTSHRAMALLRAVAEGRAEITASCEPDLFIDGLSCGDQYTAHLLAHAGLIRPAVPPRSANGSGPNSPAPATPCSRGRARTGQPDPDDRVPVRPHLWHRS